MNCIECKSKGIKIKSLFLRTRDFAVNAVKPKECKKVEKIWEIWDAKRNEEALPRREGKKYQHCKREEKTSYAIALAVPDKCRRAEARSMVISLRLKVFPMEGDDTTISACFRSRACGDQLRRLQVGRSMLPQREL